MNTAVKLDAPWVHPFERANLGKAPFVVAGYCVKKYQAIPGDPNCPMQPGASCEYCGTGIMHVYTIRSSDGRTFEVGCDCVARTGDTQLAEAARWARQASERVQWRAEAAAWHSEQRRAQAARAERNAETMAMVIEGASVAAESQNVSAWDRGIAARVYVSLTTGERADWVSDDEWTAISSGYLAAILPKSVHVGAIGERLGMLKKRRVGLVVRYEGGPTIGHNSPWGTSVLAKFRVVEGPHAGAVLVWKTKYHPTDRGDVLRLTGTVVEHSSYEDVPQTMVSRCILDDLEAS